MLVNMTAHPITLLNNEGEVTMEILSSGIVPRVEYRRIPLYAVGEVTVWQHVQTTITDLPEPKEGIYMIVSKMVAEAAKRHDLLVPTDMVRGDDGQVLGCQGFTAFLSPEWEEGYRHGERDHQVMYGIDRCLCEGRLTADLAADRAELPTGEYRNGYEYGSAHYASNAMACPAHPRGIVEIS